MWTFFGESTCFRRKYSSSFQYARYSSVKYWLIMLIPLVIGYGWMPKNYRRSWGVDPVQNESQIDEQKNRRIEISVDTSSKFWYNIGVRFENSRTQTFKHSSSGLKAISSRGTERPINLRRSLLCNPQPPCTHHCNSISNSCPPWASARRFNRRTPLSEWSCPSPIAIIRA